MKTEQEEAVDTTVWVGSGNVFADLGFPEPEKWLFKAQLTAQIQRLIDAEELSLERAAARVSMSEQELDRLLDGHLGEFSIDCLFQCLNRLGRSIEVRISSEDRQPEDARLTLVMA